MNTLTSTLSLALLAVPAAAQFTTLQVPCAADAAIYSESGTAANGSGQNLFVGANAQGNARRSLVRFDVAASIPAGSIIVQATLVLTVVQGDVVAEPITVRRVLSSWSEGPSDPTGAEGQGAPAGIGDTTWTMRDFGAASPWMTPGGDLALEHSIDGGLAIPGATYLAVGAQGLRDIESWLAQPAQNFGWCVIGDEGTPSSARRLDSRQSTTAAARPFLQISYFPPASAPFAYCVATPNSAGPGATIGWSGSTSVSANTFVLSVNGLPPSTTGVFFFGSGSGVFGAFGNGTMCVPTPHYRLGMQAADSSGSASRTLDLTTYPGTLLAPMTTASFQFWYRDTAAGGAGFNTSTAIWSPFFP